MMTPEITREDFEIPRTPKDLATYVQKTYELLAADQDLREPARLHKEPYKTFLEELVPFSHFCTWKHADRSDVLCSLVADTSPHGTPGMDAVVAEPLTGAEHVVEITWPINGKHMIHQATQLNARGHTDQDIWNHDDVSRQTDAVSLTLAIGKKKCLRDYRARGGSTIIFVFDRSLFWDDNPKHMELLYSMRDELASMRILSDHVILLLVFGDQIRIIPVERTQESE